MTGKKVFAAITTWTQICLLGITHPRSVCNQHLFTSCAVVIKQTINYSFWSIQYAYFVISSIISKLCLLFRSNVATADGTNLSLIDEVTMIKWVTWESYISQMSLVTYVFYCTFQVTIMWRTIEKSLKKILRQLLLLRNHLNFYIAFDGPFLPATYHPRNNNFVCWYSGLSSLLDFNTISFADLSKVSH